jgi:hypothetical protein
VGLAVPRRLRYFLEHDVDLQGTALRLLLRAVEQGLRARSPERRDRQERRLDAPWPAAVEQHAGGDWHHSECGQVRPVSKPSDAGLSDS